MIEAAMNGIATRFTLLPARALATAVLCASWLAACSSGTSGGVSIGSGQAPDPATVDFPLAYVMRALPAGTEDARERRTFQAGAYVWVRDRAGPDAE